MKDIDLTETEFYQRLAVGANVSTSQPSPEDATSLWDKVLKEYDQTSTFRCPVACRGPARQL